MAIRELTTISKHLFLCNGGSCKKNGAEALTDAIRAAIIDIGLNGEVHTTKTLCNGRCNDGPIVIAMPDGQWFKGIRPEEADRFVKEYLLGGVLREDNLLFRYGQATSGI
jgi:(2Fe-2S) ferredoxin